MAGIHFDITADNTSFISSVTQIQNRIRQTSSIIQEVGKNFNVDGIENQIISLTKVIQEQESAILKSKENIVRWMEQANQMRESGDFEGFAETQKDIEAETRSLSDLVAETAKYKQALSEILSLSGQGVGVKAPMYFGNQEDFEAYEELLRKREEIQSRIANFDSEGLSDRQATARIVEMRSELTVLNSEINNVELSAAKAAQSLGENGDKASEAALRYYELNKAVDAQLALINDLQIKLNAASDKLVTAVNAKDVEGARDAQIEYDNLTESLHSAKMELVNLQTEQKTAENDFKEFGDVSVSLRTQLREATMELAALTIQYRQLSDEEKRSDDGRAMKAKMDDLIEKAGELRDAMDDVNQSIKAASSDTSSFDAVAGGVNVVTSSIGAATGVLAMFGVEEESLLDIQAKLQASLAISNALTVVQTQLQGESALMLGIANVQRMASARALDLETAAKGRGTIATIALTAAQKAFNIVASANPYVLLATAIATVVGAFALYSIGAREAKESEEELAKAQEESAKKAKEAREAFVSASVEAMNTASRISNLQIAFRNANSEMEKTQVLKDAQKEFRKLGIECKSLTDTQKVLVEQGGAVVEMLRLQGKIAALNALQMKAFEKSYAAILENNGDVNYAAALAGSNEQVVALDKLIADYSRRAGAIKEQLDKSVSKTTQKGSDGSSQKLFDYEQKEKERQARISRELDKALTDAEIAQVENDAERTRREREIQFERDIQQIKDQREKWLKEAYKLAEEKFNATNKNKNLKFSDTPEGKNGWQGMSLTDEQVAIIDAQIEERTAKNNREIAQEQQARIQAMRDYLKEYGTLQQKRYAIAKEYADKIAQAEAEGNPWKVKQLQAEKERNLSNAKANELSQGIDFSQMTYGMSKVMDSVMRATYKRIQDYKETDEYKNSKPESKKAIADLENQLVSQGVTGAMSPFASWKEINKHSEELDEAIKRVTEANKKHEEAEKNLTEQEERLQKLKANPLASKTEISMQEGIVKAAEESFKKTGEEQKEAQQNQNNAANQVKQDLTKVHEGLQNFQNAISQITSGSLMGFADGVSNLVAALIGDQQKFGKGLTGLIGEQASGIVGAILTVIDALGDKPVEFIDNLFESLSRVIEAVISHIPEIIASAVEGIGSMIGSVFTGIGGIFGIGGSSNREEIEKENARLTDAMALNTEAVNRLTKEMQKQNPEQAYQSYKTAKAIMEQNEKNARQIMENNAYMYDGGHSLNSDMNDIMAWNGMNAMIMAIALGYNYNNGNVVQRIFDYLKKKGGTETPIGDYDLGGLIRTLSARDWNLLFGDEDGRALMEELQNIINQAQDEDNYNGMMTDILNFANEFSQEVYDELMNSFLEAATHIGFDSMYDSFISALMDMDKSAQDFSNDFEGYLRNAIYQAMATDAIKPLLDKWYKGMAAAMASAEANGKYLSSAEIRMLMKTGGTLKDEEGNDITFKSIEEIEKIGLELRDAIEELGLYNGKNGQQQQSATANSIQNISYDQADSLVGIGLNHTILLEQGNATRDLILQNIQTLQVGVGNTLNELRNLTVQANGTRETMLKVMKERFESFDNKLTNIYKELQAQ